jgi:hypothetical protein
MSMITTRDGIATYDTEGVDGPKVALSHGWSRLGGANG